MAKKNIQIDDLFADLPDRLPKEKSFGNMLAQGTSKQQVDSAKGNKVVGDRKRKTIYLPPELIENIDFEAKEQGFPIMDFYHWLVNESWQAYKDGSLQAKMTEQVRVIRGLKID